VVAEFQPQASGDTVHLPKLAQCVALTHAMKQSNYAL
jgi:hypothetical protein